MGVCKFRYVEESRQRIRQSVLLCPVMNQEQPFEGKTKHAYLASHVLEDLKGNQLGERILKGKKKCQILGLGHVTTGYNSVINYAIVYIAIVISQYFKNFFLKVSLPIQTLIGSSLFDVEKYAFKSLNVYFWEICHVH